MITLWQNIGKESLKNSNRRNQEDSIKMGETNIIGSQAVDNSLRSEEKMSQELIKKSKRGKK